MRHRQLQEAGSASIGGKRLATGGRKRLAGLVTGAALLLSACGTAADAQAPAPAAAAPTPRPIAAPVAQPSTPTTNIPFGWQDVATTVMIAPAGESAAGWSEAFVIPHGAAPEQVGNGLGLEPLAEHYGPSLATVDAAGRWWVADTYKERIARYDSSGTFIDAVEIAGTGPLEGLAVFDSGQAIATTSTGSWLTVGADGVGFRSGQSDARLAFTDGARAFGWEPWSDRLRAVSLEGNAPSSSRVDYFTTRAGNRFSVDYAPDRDDVVVVTLPDATPPTRVALQVQSELGRDVYVSVEPDADQAGNVHLLLLGYLKPAEGDASGVTEVPRASHVVISPEGDVLANRAVPNPYGQYDYGLPHRLAVAPNGQAHVVVLAADGVHVWRSAQVWAGSPAAP